jgi:hypothetical protein
VTDLARGVGCGGSARLATRAERAAGVLYSLCNKLGDSNRKMYEFQMAVVEAAVGIPLLVRVLELRGHADMVHAEAAVVVSV